MKLKTKISKMMFIVSVCIFIAACEQCEWEYDKENYKKAFLECMNSVKENPKSTHYADQDEVILECRRYATELYVEMVCKK